MPELSERRCEHPHPRIPGQRCNAVNRCQFSDGEGIVQCWRCRGPVYFDFRGALTALAR